MVSAPICCFLVLEQLLDRLAHVLEDHLVVGLFLLFDPVLQVDRKSEFAFQLAIEAGDIPLFVDAVGRNVATHHLGHHVVADVGDGVGDIVDFQQFVALAIDHLALVVGDVVELQQVLADVEVVLLDLALGLLDLAADHAIFQRIVFLHAESASSSGPDPSPPKMRSRLSSSDR